MPRAKVLAQFDRIRQSQAAEAKRANEVAEKLKARDEKLKAWGVDLDAYEKDPERALEEAAQRRYQRRLDDATLPEAELKQRKLQEELEATKKRLAERDEADKKRAEEEAQTQRTERVKARANEVAKEIAGALEEAGLPRNGFTVARMIDLRRQARQDGLDVSTPELVKRVNAGIRADAQHVVAGLTTGKAVAEFLGKNATELLRQFLLEDSLPAQEAFNPKPKTNAGSGEVKSIGSKHPNRYITLDQLNQVRS